MTKLLLAFAFLSLVSLGCGRSDDELVGSWRLNVTTVTTQPDGQLLDVIAGQGSVDFGADGSFSATALSTENATNSFHTASGTYYLNGDVIEFTNGQVTWTRSWERDGRSLTLASTDRADYMTVGVYSMVSP